jgi:Holliday junction resolvase RusA-like endonuclease
MNFTIDYEPTPKGVPRTRYVKGHTITYYHWKTMEALDNIRAIIDGMNLEPFPAHVSLKLEVTFYRSKSKLPTKERNDALP